MSEELISGYDIRGTEETGLTIECAWNVGKALADWLSTTGKVIVVYAIDQQRLAEALIEGVRLQGRAVINGGVADKERAISQVKALGLSGAAVIGFDGMEKMMTIELYQEEARLIDSQTGLMAIRDLVVAGNFVPAAVRGELTALA